MARGLYLILLICLPVSSVTGQMVRPMKRPYADWRPWHFGFFVGMNFQDLKPGLPDREDADFRVSIPSYSSGITVGLLVNRNLNSYFDLRFTPAIHIGKKNMEWTDKRTEDVYRKTFYSNYIMEPLEVKYSAVRMNNFRPYILGGVFALQDLGRKKEGTIQLKKWDAGFVVGAGVDLYFRRFKLCPEIKYVFGLRNMMLTDVDAEVPYPEMYLSAPDKLKTRMLVITISFE